MKKYSICHITWLVTLIGLSLTFSCQKEEKPQLNQFDKVVDEKTKHTKHDASDEVKMALKKEVDRLKSMGFEQKALKKGDSVPNVQFLKPTGEKIQLKDLFKDNIVVLNFCRGLWSSYCKIHMKFANGYDEKLKEYKIKTVYVVPDFYQDIEKFCKDKKTKHLVLSDPESQAAAGFNLRYEMSKEYVEIYKREKSIDVDLLKVHGNNKNLSAITSSYVIGHNGKIHLAHIHPNHRLWLAPEHLYLYAEDLGKDLKKQKMQMDGNVPNK